MSKKQAMPIAANEKRIADPQGQKPCSITAADDFSAGPGGKGHPGRNGDSVADKANRAVAKQVRHTDGMWTPGGIGIEDARTVGSRWPGMAHHKGRLSAIISRRHLEGVGRACGTAGPR